MIIINTANDNYFTLNGIQYAKIYNPIIQGLNTLGIYNIYDVSQQIVNSTFYDEFQINNQTFNSLEDTIQALLPVIHNTVSNGGSNGDSDGLLAHLNDYQNPHLVTKYHLNLGNVENIAPDDLPISEDTQEALDLKSDIVDTGTKLSANPTNSTINLLDVNGTVLDTLSVAFLNNEGTTLSYNSTNETIEIKNDDGDLLSSVPVGAFLSNLPDNINLVGSTLQLRDSVNTVLSTVSFGINNINGLENELDNINDGILDNTQDIIINGQNIATNESDISSNGVDIAFNTNNISINSQGLGTAVQTQVGHINNQNNPHNVTASQVGLGNVTDGAEINVKSDWNSTSGATEILNKPNSFPPIGHNHSISDVIGLQGALNNIQNDVDDNTTDLNDKVDKVIGKGLSTNDYTNTEKTKLAGIEVGAQVNRNISDAITSTSSINSASSKAIKAVNDKANANTTNINNISNGLGDVATSNSYDDLDDIPLTFTPSTHSHDDRYYTETESNNLLNLKFNKSGGTLIGNNSSSSDEDLIILKGNGENGKSLVYQNAFGSLAKVTGTKLGTGASANEGILKFETAINAVLSEKMRINSDGKVGIGVSSPSEILDVNGNVKANDFIGSGSQLFNVNANLLDGYNHSDFVRINGNLNQPINGFKRFTANDDSPVISVFAQAPHSNGYIFSNGNYGFLDYHPDSSKGVRLAALNNLRLGISNNSSYGTGTTFNESVRIISNGYVGIGTDSPTDKLTVNGNISNKAGKGDTLTLYCNNSPRNNRILLGADDEGAFVKGTWASGGTDRISFRGFDDTEKMSISKNGNVGINTSSPSERLEVIGNIKTSGNIILNNGQGLKLSNGNNNSLMDFDFPEISTSNGTFRIGRLTTTTGTLNTSFQYGASLGVLIEHKTGKIIAEGDIIANQFKSDSDISTSTTPFNTTNTDGGNINYTVTNNRLISTGFFNADSSTNGYVIIGNLPIGARPNIRRLVYFVDNTGVLKRISIETNGDLNMTVTASSFYEFDFEITLDLSIV